MPELPEVETVLRTLETQIKDLEILDVEVLWDNIIVNQNAEFIKQIQGQHFREFQRRGKYLLFVLDESMLIVHLRMEGKFYLLDPSIPRDKHTHVILHLSDGREMRYHDVRKFGKMALYPLRKDFDYPMLANIGYDAFDERLSAEELYQKWHKRSGCLKQMLLNQRFLAGIGNIYADEICFSCGLHPSTPVTHLNRADFDRILVETRRILRGAIKAGGTTIRSYTSSLGVTGLFQLELKVHQRSGKSCPVCGQEIIKMKVGGRGTYVCVKCQKKQ